MGKGTLIPNHYRMKSLHKGTKILTIFTFALLDLVFISDSFMTGLAVKPGSEIYIQSFKDHGNVKLSLTSDVTRYIIDEKV